MRQEERDALADQVETLGRAFGRHADLGAHLKVLRLYWLALRRGLVTRSDGELRVHVTRDWVVEWLRVLRIPPHHTHYAVRPVGAACPVCPPAEGETSSRRTVMNFPGGAKVACATCGIEWLEEGGGGS